ncbi:MAG TPA: hypothetical protein VGO80_12425 [Solirubrobacteraceae bacterium]|nr:hypothetical protein [Solirubrobacteraceae bacterium]
MHLLLALELRRCRDDVGDVAVAELGMQDRAAPREPAAALRGAGRVADAQLVKAPVTSDERDLAALDRRVALDELRRAEPVDLRLGAAGDVQAVDVAPRV